MNWLIPVAGLGGGQGPVPRAAAYGWQHDQLATNVEEIGAAGRELYDRLMTLTKHFAGVGRWLGRAVAEYNRTVDALETRVLSAAERLRRLAFRTRRMLAIATILYGITLIINTLMAQVALEKNLGW